MIKKAIVREADGSFNERVGDLANQSQIGQSYGLEIGVKKGDVVAYGEWGDESAPLVLLRSRAEAPDVTLAEGEVMLYMEDGARRIHLKANGEIEVRNDSGSLVLQEDGKTRVTSLIVEKDIEVAGRVDGVKISTHTHPTPAGPSGGPTP